MSKELVSANYFAGFMDGYLKCIENLSHDANHGSSFDCVKIDIEKKGNLKDSLKTYYDRYISISSRSKFSKQNENKCSISIHYDVEMSFFKSQLHNYFFASLTRKTAASRPDIIIKEKVINDFIDKIVRHSLVTYHKQSRKKDVRIHYINVNLGKIFYDIMYDDFVVDFGKEFYLIHLGFSD